MSTWVMTIGLFESLFFVWVVIPFALICVIVYLIKNSQFMFRRKWRKIAIERERALEKKMADNPGYVPYFYETYDVVEARKNAGFIENLRDDENGGLSSTRPDLKADGSPRPRSSP